MSYKMLYMRDKNKTIHWVGNVTIKHIDIDNLSEGKKLLMMYKQLQLIPYLNCLI